MDYTTYLNEIGYVSDARIVSQYTLINIATNNFYKCKYLWKMLLISEKLLLAREKIIDIFTYNIDLNNFLARQIIYDNIFTLKITIQ